MLLNKKIKAFTLAELLVTLALTAILVTLSYAGLNYIQKLLKQYNEQSYFVTQMSELNRRLSLQADQAGFIKSRSGNELTFGTDSFVSTLLFYPGHILLKKNGVTDSFLLENSALRLSYEKLNSYESQLVNKLEFDVIFNKQKFHCAFSKTYDAYSKFIIESEHGRDRPF